MHRPNVGLKQRTTLRPFIVVGAAVLALALFFLHPYFFGLPGRVREMIFSAELHRAMSRTDVIRLAGRLGGMDMRQRPIDSSDPRWGLDVTHGAPGNLDVLFADSLTFCVTNGKWYTLYFDADGKLRSWSEQPWGSAC